LCTEDRAKGHVVGFSRRGGDLTKIVSGEPEGEPVESEIGESGRGEIALTEVNPIGFGRQCKIKPIVENKTHTR
jgi:hypothetical protein